MRRSQWRCSQQATEYVLLSQLLGRHGRPLPRLRFQACPVISTGDSMKPASRANIRQFVYFSLKNNKNFIVLSCQSSVSYGILERAINNIHRVQQPTRITSSSKRLQYRLRYYNKEIQWLPNVSGVARSRKLNTNNCNRN